MKRGKLARRLSEVLASRGKIKILFICLGNICRSPAAEAVMSKTVEETGTAGLWEIDSAGTAGYHIGELADRRMRSHAGSRGITLLHRARKVSASDLEDFDMIVAMDHSNMENLLRLSSSVENDVKIVPMAAFFPGGELAPENDGCQERPQGIGRLICGPTAGYDHVPDPYYSGAEGFELVLDMLEVGCRNIASLVPASV